MRPSRGGAGRGCGSANRRVCDSRRPRRRGGWHGNEALPRPAPRLALPRIALRDQGCRQPWKASGRRRGLGGWPMLATTTARPLGQRSGKRPIRPRPHCDRPHRLHWPGTGLANQIGKWSRRRKRSALIGRLAAPAARQRQRRGNGAAACVAPSSAAASAFWTCQSRFRGGMHWSGIEGDWPAPPRPSGPARCRQCLE